MENPTRNISNFPTAFVTAFKLTGGLALIGMVIGVLMLTVDGGLGEKFALALSIPVMTLMGVAGLGALVLSAKASVQARINK